MHLSLKSERKQLSMLHNDASKPRQSKTLWTHSTSSHPALQAQLPVGVSFPQSMSSPGSCHLGPGPEALRVPASALSTVRSGNCPRTSRTACETRWTWWAAGLQCWPHCPQRHPFPPETENWSLKSWPAQRLALLQLKKISVQAAMLQIVCIIWWVSHTAL